MLSETALIPLVRGSSVVAEVLPVAKVGSAVSKEIVALSKKFPIFDKTAGYENQTAKMSTGA